MCRRYIIFISSWALYKFVYVEEKGGKHKSSERAAARSALRDVLGHPEAFFPLKFDDTGVAIAPIQVCESLPFHPVFEFHHVRQVDSSTIEIEFRRSRAAAKAIVFDPMPLLEYFHVGAEKASRVLNADNGLFQGSSV